MLLYRLIVGIGGRRSARARSCKHQILLHGLTIAYYDLLKMSQESLETNLPGLLQW